MRILTEKSRWIPNGLVWPDPFGQAGKDLAREHHTLKVALGQSGGNGQMQFEWADTIALGYPIHSQGDEDLMAGYLIELVR